MFREVSGDIEWGTDVLREEKKAEEKDIHTNQATDTELPIFSTPVPDSFKIHPPMTNF